MFSELARRLTCCLALFAVIAIPVAITTLGCSREAAPLPPIDNQPPIDDQAKLPLPAGKILPAEEIVSAEEILPAGQPELLAYPLTNQWQTAGPRQKTRAERSFAQLKLREVPVYSGPLFVEDDEEVQLQDPQEVARRAIILWAVALRAEATPREEVVALIEKSNAWDSVSPMERRFLEDPNPDPGLSQALVWRLESLWVMLWALGHADQLDWPSNMCNVPRLVEIMQVQESSQAFITEAKLRSVQEILDAQDLTMRIHWAIRDAGLRERPTIPERLDWSGPFTAVPVTQCPGVGVVEERHHALNWLVKFLNPANWDRVDTPT